MRSCISESYLGICYDTLYLQCTYFSPTFLPTCTHLSINIRSTYQRHHLSNMPRPKLIKSPYFVVSSHEETKILAHEEHQREEEKPRPQPIRDTQHRRQRRTATRSCWPQLRRHRSSSLMMGRDRCWCCFRRRWWRRLMRWQQLRM